jgi:predicted CXXCH cytochrome family protein
MPTTEPKREVHSAAAARPGGNQGAARPAPRWIVIAGGLLLGAAALAAGYYIATRETSEADTTGASPAPAESETAGNSDAFPLTPISTSPFLNTGPDAKYVGTESCLACHEDEHESFRHTGMGRSMATVDLSREPEGGQFDHSLSKRRYEVRREGGRMWHRELLLHDGPEEVVISEFPVKYVTGSGRHSLTYLVETDGYLVESPITWYASRQAWGMSPGYDRAEHSGFQREVGEGCLICHAGSSEAIDGSVHRMRIIEQTIGCERCHGPGSLHVKKHSGESQTAAAAEEKIDYTIVNPAHLARELQEAVCQQCHLRTSATVLSRGRKLADFRPGLPLQDFRQDYTLAIPDKPMTVVGHVEQMHNSRCFQGSDRFTCTTCHSPHGEPPPEQRVAYYKAVCLECHQEAHCKVDKETLAAQSADNNCVQCHMPTGGTDIPHLAFTHHRVGIHQPVSKDAKTVEGPPGTLRPFLDVSRLSPIDQKRSLGLAYYDLALHADDPKNVVHYRQQGLALLNEVHQAGLRDGPTSASIASLRFDLKLGDVVSYANEALSDGNLAGMDRSNALFVIADTLYREGRFHETLHVLEPLNELRRHSVHWLLKAQCEEALEQKEAMVQSLDAAVRINPRIPEVHRYLADYYRKKGNSSRAEWHERLARP